MSNLTARIVTAVVGIPLVLLVNRAGGWVFALFIGAAAAIGAFELCRMARHAGYTPLVSLSLAASATLAALPLFVVQPQPVWIGVIVLTALVAGVWYLQPATHIGGFHNWMLTLFPVIYVGLLLGHLGLLHGDRMGLRWVVICLVLTWAYDTGAYFGGTLFGRRPFMNHLSPRKTVEGVAGGLVLAAIVGCVGMPALRLDWWQSPLLGVLAGMAAQCGDLAESMIKRQTGVKDSGTIIPGHGGLLDRIDSLLFTGPVVAYLALAFGYGS